VSRGLGDVYKRQAFALGIGPSLVFLLDRGV